jgi:phage-related protein (TIGR01555 family)
VPPPKIEPRLFGVPEHALAGLGPKPKSVVPLELPKPMPGVVPKGAPTMAQDSYTPDAYQFVNQGFWLADGIRWLGYPYLAELSQRPEYRRISDVIAKEMTRKWIKIQASGDDKSDKITKIEAAMDRFKIQDVFTLAALQDGLYGRSQIYVDTGDTDNRDELNKPLALTPAKISIGKIKGFRVIDPMWTYPGVYNASDPLRPDYYKPQTWYVMGKEVHGSRLLTFVGREVPDLLKPAYMFGGLSMSQMAKPYIDNWLRTRQSVSDLLHSFSVSGIKTDMMALLGGAMFSGDLVNRMEMFNRTRDNRGLLMIDKEKEEFFNVSTPLGTLDHLQAQAQEQICSVAGMPLVKYTGITPSGLNASSDGEIRVWYDWISAQQEHLFSAHLERIIRIIQLNEFGEIDEEIGFRFEPLWEMSPKERAEIRKIDADAAVEAIGAGVLSPEDERRRLATAEDSLYHGLDVDALPDPDSEAEGEGLLPDGEEDDDAVMARLTAAAAGRQPGVKERVVQ